jgi:peptidoglycan hydrolase-like protein with peptidoglycan-binding domain
MGHRTRGWLIGLGTLAAAGAMAIGLAPMAGASPAAKQQPGAAYVPSGRTLTFGSHGRAVKALQRRLNYLHYYAGPVDGEFGWDTMEAVWAFKEVQSGEAEPNSPDVVGPAMQRQLVHPKLPKVLIKRAHWSRVEINKNVGVLVVYRDKDILLISHVSTAAYYRPDGSGFVTPDGTYRAWQYDPGCVPDATYGGCLYNPVFFIGTAFAIHGMPNPTSTFGPNGVPLNAASHGCVRIPLDISVFFHKLVHVSPTNGTLIYIRGHDQNETGIFSGTG